MRITKLGHSCLLVEDSGSRLLIDPGAFSPRVEGIEGLDAVLITHQHPDHVDIERVLALRDANAEMTVYAEEQSASALRAAGVEVTTMRAGDVVTAGSFEVRAIGEQHAVIHADIPVVGNVGYLIDGRVFHPGDALTLPDVAVDVLALPVVAPWMAAKEAVDYLRVVAPRFAVPIHDAITTAPQLYDNLMRNLGPEATRYERIDEAPLTV